MDEEILRHYPKVKDGVCAVAKCNSADVRRTYVGNLCPKHIDEFIDYLMKRDKKC